MTQSFRIERDTMGECRIPSDRLYGASTQRAVENFPISGLRFGRSFIRSLALVKASAAKVNRELRALEDRAATAIIAAAESVAEGHHDADFPLDIFQTGSGTSTNMNANEVIANLANLSLGGALGAKSPVHPNDHVNLGQSSNDVIPTVIHLTAFSILHHELIPALQLLTESFAKKEREFADVLKTGRTHLQDATPITLGQEFGGYRQQLAAAIERLKAVYPRLGELAIGGTAVGTGINAHREFGKRMADELSVRLSLPLTEARNHFEAQSAKDTCVELSGALKVLACALMKIANDLRWMASGPRSGLFEILLPETQPGSSIMPGKVNPVIPECVCQISAQVIGHDATVTIAAMSGNFELNVMMPVLSRCLIESLELMTSGAKTFRERCVDGIEANREQCEATIERGLQLVTSLAPAIGYDKAAEVAKHAFATGKTIREVVRERKLLSEEELSRRLDPRTMLTPK